VFQILIAVGKKENLKESILAGIWVKYPLLGMLAAIQVAIISLQVIIIIIAT